MNKLFKENEIASRLLEQFSQMVVIIKNKTRILHWGEIPALITGYESERALEKSFLGKEAKISDNFLEIIKQDGTMVRVRLLELEPVPSDYYFVIFLESDRSEWCSNLEKQTNLHNSILRSMKEGVISIDQDRIITSFSPRAEFITGCSANEAIGRPCYEIIKNHYCQHGCLALELEEGKTDSIVKSTEINTPAGNRCPVTEMAIPLKTRRGERMGSLLLIEDRRPSMIKIQDNDDFFGIIGRSYPMRRIFQVIKQVATTDVTVLITGESGTGKEMIARAVHTISERSKGPFQAINCAALPEQLLESELFGHVKGAFTGATRDRAGSIEMAKGGTLFLDEIGELPFSLQSKLLRFLQEHEYQRVGESKISKADIRIITATNRNLKEEVNQGNFREDLYFRVKVIPIEVPPLRERREDIPLLAITLLEETSSKHNKSNISLAPEVIGILREYSWPGNVRELLNVLEYGVALASGDVITKNDLPPEILGKKGTIHSDRCDLDAGESARVLESERDRIVAALNRNHGNKTRTAEELGIHRVTLYRKIKKYGLE
ncbi:MAG: sigma 54-interacting transcriptional regulator [Deltaproteobacteria bacterium]|jgi:PAS domain S-box-containing protein|nr:sigma 54-interacting transcriptional regulator [Deltaproteobacteria bacterium]